MGRLLWREYLRNRRILATGVASVLLPLIIALAFDLNGKVGFIGLFFLSCVFFVAAIQMHAAKKMGDHERCQAVQDHFAEINQPDRPLAQWVRALINSR